MLWQTSYRQDILIVILLHFPIGSSSVHMFTIEKTIAAPHSAYSNYGNWPGAGNHCTPYCISVIEKDMESNPNTQ
ncbi:hypothetical protein RIF29_41243 [Crotalaria pallida]|uniref:Uncharacterized protein n=1 Tax=Crotalaria pallida TaxID=3830 RepID=A0AAN9HP64_CROPI